MGDNSLALHSINEPSYIVDGDPGRSGGGTYTTPGNPRTDPTIQDYENIFGPAARDVKLDLQRNKRHARWHLPDALKGSNPWIADRIDGLITDTSASPFTTYILPYMYIENVDQKIKWNRWSFDEGLSSRVPYESAARTLTQTKTSYAGYTVRQGLAITLEHNFMMSPKGRENFKHQLQQVVGSIQYTNDIDVHVALITAPSYAKEKAEKYFTRAKTNHQVMREYIDLFGFMQKNPNAMDIMIEEARSVLRSWGASEPSFLLTNSKLTFQMTMIPEKTEYLTQGADGVRRLKTGPNIDSYRGLRIINSRSFSLEDGAPPRDVLRRRVRTAEYYRIPWTPGVEKKEFSFYDESKDAWQKFTWSDLFRMSHCQHAREPDDDYDQYNMNPYDPVIEFLTTKLPDRTGPDVPAPGAAPAPNPGRVDMMIKREIIEAMEDSHYLRAFPIALGGGVFVANGANDPWAFLLWLTQDVGHTIPFNGGAVPLYLGGPNGMYGPGAPAAATIDYIYAAWGLPDAAAAADPANFRAQHDRLVVDLKNFLLGRTRHMDPTKVALFSRLDLYSRNHLDALLSMFFDFTNIMPPGGAIGDPSLALAAFRNSPLGNAVSTQQQMLAAWVREVEKARWEIVVIRPNIEHEMLGIVMGRGGVDELGATLWGQTELSVYDDSMHGIWGMSYKYNERAIVFNHKNLVRLWDIAYDGYNGGKDCRAVDWSNDDHLEDFRQRTYELNRPFDGPSMMVMRFKNIDNADPWPSPIVFHDTMPVGGDGANDGTAYIDGEHQHQVGRQALRVFNRQGYHADYQNYLRLMPNFTRIHNPKNAGSCSEENETSCNVLAFQGTMRIYGGENRGLEEEISGNGHHGVDAVGMASVRAGKGIAMGSLHSGAAKAVRIV